MLKLLDENLDIHFPLDLFGKAWFSKGIFCNTTNLWFHEFGGFMASFKRSTKDKKKRNIIAGIASFPFIKMLDV